MKGTDSITNNKNAEWLPTSVYPAASEVNVKVISVNEESLTVQINDAAGKPVFSSRNQTTNNSLNSKIDLSGFASGVYTVYIPELNYYYKLVIIK